jgi:putative membrane protein
MYRCLGWKWVQIPWLPMGLIGTALAFYIGFKNNASYDRTWEARKIWGGIVNDSRAFAAMSLSYISNLHRPEPLPDTTLEQLRKSMIYRHLAWVNALRFQMHQPREWEHDNRRFKEHFRMNKDTPQTAEELQDLLSQLLPAEELHLLKTVSNKATHILKLQSTALAAIRQDKLIDDLRHMELQRLISSLYDQQGKTERIKNFPFPRQYASTGINLIKLFTFVLPFGLLKTFDDMGPYLVWLTIPFSAVVNWVFVLMEMIGDFSENPFEGSYNDVPIVSISRNIEIDLREMLQEVNIPGPVTPVEGFLM